MADPAPSFRAHAVRGRSLCWLHPLGRHEQTDHFNVRIAAATPEDLRRIEIVRYMGNHMELDWQTLVVRHGSHMDPLYVWEEDGEWVLETEAFVPPSEPAQPMVLVRVDGRAVQVPVVHIVGSPSDWGDLKTARARTDSTGWEIEVRASSEIEVVRQTIADGTTVEEREILGPGVHGVWVPASLSDYVGLSVSQRLPDGAELEHKHVLRGRVHD